MTLARECIEAMERTTVANPWAPTGSPSFAMPASDRDKLLAVLRTLAERGPSEGMIRASADDPAMQSVESAVKVAAVHGVELRWPDDGLKLSPIQRSFRAMLRVFIAEIEEER